jgi:hypothetical protein
MSDELGLADDASVNCVADLRLLLGTGWLVALKYFVAVADHDSFTARPSGSAPRRRR